MLIRRPGRAAFLLRRARASASSPRSRSRGQALVELALVTPVLLVLLLGAVDLGRLFYARITVTNAAREGAMMAAKEPGSVDGRRGLLQLQQDHVRGAARAERLVGDGGPR